MLWTRLKGKYTNKQIHVWSAAIILHKQELFKVGEMPTTWILESNTIVIVMGSVQTCSPVSLAWIFLQLNGLCLLFWILLLMYAVTWLLVLQLRVFLLADARIVRWIFQFLSNFHRTNIDILTQKGVDILACETLPCSEEALAIAEVLKDFPGVKAWITFTTKVRCVVCKFVHERVRFVHLWKQNFYRISSFRILSSQFCDEISCAFSKCPYPDFASVACV